MNNDTINKIINTDADELYEKAIAFKEKKDYTNYAVHLTMAANKYYDLAIEECTKDYHNEQLHRKQNFLETIPFYEATKDYGYSAHYLGYIYKSGHSVIKDGFKACELYKIGIEKGNMHSMSNLARAITDKKKKKELYEMAISKGNCSTMNLLGKKYLTGCSEYGIDKDLKKALELFESAMNKCCKKKAIENLVKLYSIPEMKKDVAYVINYFTKIDHPEKLGQIYKFDSYIINCIKENNKLENHITQTKKLIFN